MKGTALFPGSFDPFTLGHKFVVDQGLELFDRIVIAIGVNSEAIDPKTITSWADLWKPEYKSSLLRTDEAREVIQMALRKRG